MRKIHIAASLAALLATAGACDDDGGEGTAPVQPAAVAATAAAHHQAAAGSTVPAPSVRVTDSRGQPLAQVPVAFAVTAGGGSLAQPGAVTDAGGVATGGAWTLGRAPGANEVTATVAGLPPVRFTATAHAAAVAQLARAGGDGQTGVVGTALADSLAVRATDAFGNPVAGVAVTWALTGGGALSAATATTGADGHAKIRLTLGATPGAATVVATAAGAGPVSFGAQAMAGPAARLAVHAGDDQGAGAGQAVPVAPAVRVTDALGNALQGVPVQFAVARGGGAVSGANASTDSAGVAAVGRWTLGSAPGANEVTATVAGLPPVRFSAVAQVGAVARLARAGGDNQTGVVGTALADSLAVRATDAHGNPVPGVTVTFSARGGGALSSATATTSAEGYAKVRLTLGSRPGDVTVKASAEGAEQVTFTAHAVAGPASRLAVHAGDDQTAPAGAPVPVPPAVRVTDALGNPVEGVPVQFTVAAGGASVSGGNAVSDSNGVAAVGRWTLGAAGTNRLTASAAGVGSVTFSARAEDPCVSSVAHTFGSTSSGELRSIDCRLTGGQPVDFLSLQLGETRHFTIDVSGTGFDAFAYLFDAGGRVVATDDDGGPGADARIRVIAPAGSFFIGASTYASAVSREVVGTYTVTTAAADGDVTGCPSVFVLPGITTSQQLSNTDCPGYWYGSYGDRYQVELKAGQSITIRQTSTAFLPYLVVYPPNGFSVGGNWPEGNTSQIVYTASAAGRYVIEAGSWWSSQTGAYTLSIQ